MTPIRTLCEAAIRRRGFSVAAPSNPLSLPVTINHHPLAEPSWREAPSREAVSSILRLAGLFVR
jgi:hypothetical protein